MLKVTDYMVDAFQEDQGRVALMTVHSAKGLEFPTVFIIGLEQGIFPHSRSLNDFDQMEEERRLAYVAITRAQNRLFLTHARQRWLFGQTQVNHPSEFLQAIPAELFGDESPGGPPAPRSFQPPQRRSEEVWVDTSFDQSLPDDDG